MITLSVLKNGETSYSTATDRIFDPEKMDLPYEIDGGVVFGYEGKKVFVDHDLDDIQTLAPKSFLRLSVKKKGENSFSTVRPTLFLPDRMELPRAYGASDTVFRYNQDSNDRKHDTVAVIVDESFSTVQTMIDDLTL